jgi:pimeloyl-ACP methyl ester carboxylesterase
MQLNVDGEEVYVYTGARALIAAQPRVLFVHGAAHDHSVWALQSRYFAHHGYSVLAVDLPGHGRSTGAPLPSVEAIAQWLPRVLDAFRRDGRCADRPLDGRARRAGLRCAISRPRQADGAARAGRADAGQR